MAQKSYLELANQDKLNPDNSLIILLVTHYAAPNVIKLLQKELTDIVTFCNFYLSIKAITGN